jgi:exodeoxyribonuclease VII large subunit
MRLENQRAEEREQTYTVAEINGRARTLLEREVGAVWVEAEVVSATLARSGHLYFNLADPGGKAQLSAVMWQGQARRYAGRIVQGAQVRCHGRVTVYEAGGKYQLVADRAEEAGAGAKARQLAELRARLESEGLFDPDRKRPLPAVPWCVGAVTSRSGAALRDVIKVLSRRFPARLLLAHATVQGSGAPGEIVAALERLAARTEVEVVIVGRGGGSTEDLDAFNDESVVRAVAGHPVPVVSAVGHEIDVTLVDLAADRRAATPSEAAELVVPERERLAARLADGRAGLGAAMRHRIGGRRERLATLSGTLRTRDPRVRLVRSAERLARLQGGLGRWPERVIARARGDLASAGEGLYRWPGPALDRARGELGRLAGQLQALSPLASLERGYAVVRRRDDGVVVRSAGEAPTGTRIDVTLARGSLECKVEASDEPDGAGEGDEQQ